MAKRTFFYSTANDIKPYIQEVEGDKSIKYLLAGLMEKNVLAEYDSISKYPSLGKATNISKFLCDRFLVAYKDTQIRIDAVAQSKGDLKYEVSEVVNPDTIIFWPAGVIIERNAIIEGSVSTNSASIKSIELYNTFIKKMKKHFVRYKNYYLGAEANELLKNGWRFSENLERPEAYDLK